jgi:predicted flap endonuclease-1-like 5' DNA nuclease
MSDGNEQNPLNPANPMAFAMAWTAFGLGMTAHMLGAMSQAFAAAGQGGAQSKPAAKAAEPGKPAVKETAKVLSFETAAKAKSSKPVHAAPAKPEDLKVISGIGPKLETLLNKLGIFTVAQIAAWSADDAAKVDQDLQLNGRVLRDDWRGQAKQMAEG